MADFKTMLTARRDPQASPALNTWHALNASVMQLDEQQLLKALEEEIRTQRRDTFINRIYCRFSRLRMSRERVALGLPETNMKRG